MLKSRLEKLNIQIEAIELLNTARNLLRCSYKELSEVVNIPESLLCRYVNGELVPSIETAQQIINKLENLLNLENVLKQLIRVRENIIDLNRIIFNPHLLKLYGRRIKLLFSNFGITKVLTAATDGIPLAVSAAMALDVELAVAKQYKDVFEDSFYEVSYITESPPRRITLYIPKSQLNRNDKILIVDDIVRTGRTINALIELAKCAGCSVVGISVLIAIGSKWLEKLKNVDIRYIDVVLQIPSP